MRRLGFVPRRDLVGLYTTATVFLFPSLYETFSLPLAEIMACATPPVTSKVYAIPETVGGGILCKPTEPEEFIYGIEKIPEGKDLRKYLEEKALERAEAFSWKESAKKFLKVYKKVSR